jgi:hypothetical protein
MFWNFVSFELYNIVEEMELEHVYRHSGAIAHVCNHTCKSGGSLIELQLTLVLRDFVLRYFALT